MSERSSAWYRIPGNRERRLASMRTYMEAMTRLARRYPAQYQQAYRQALRDFTISLAAAAQRAYGQVRDAHKQEFRALLDEIRRTGDDGKETPG